MIATATRVDSQFLSDDFERIFRDHSVFVYRTAYRVLGNSEDAEDVLQSLFVRLLRHELPPEFGKSPKAYLYRAAVNVSLNLIRSRQRTVLTGDEEEFQRAEAWEESRGEAATRERLRAALAELNPKAAEILILRHVHGYSDKEIAALLGTSRGTIAVSLFRSRTRLRKIIRAYLGEQS